MITAAEVNRIIMDLILGGKKVPHSTSQPVIENGKLTKVLKGEDGLAISINQMVGTSAPTDWTKVLDVVYKVAESVGKELVLKDL